MVYQNPSYFRDHSQKPSSSTPSPSSSPSLKTFPSTMSFNPLLPPPPHPPPHVSLHNTPTSTFMGYRRPLPVPQYHPHQMTTQLNPFPSSSSSSSFSQPMMPLIPPPPLPPMVSNTNMMMMRPTASSAVTNTPPSMPGIIMHSSSILPNSTIPFSSSSLTTPTTLSTPSMNAITSTSTKESSSSSSSSQLSKKRKILRKAGGEVWVDDTLDDWDPNDYRIFCGDLGNEVTDDILLKAFSKYPSVQKAKVIRDKITSKTRGYGFVSFKQVDDFVAAIREMNGKYVGNRPIKLRKSNWKDRNIDVKSKKEFKNLLHQSKKK